MSVPWRLLSDPPASGPWNMAVDDVLLDGVRAGRPPTLRFYAWRGPWLSLGYAQALAASRAEACGRAGVGVVRRVTGGRAVLHGEDLTYAVVAPETALPAGLQATYALVSLALLRGLTGLDVPVVAAAAMRSEAADFDCFARSALDELCAGGRKLAGSAQRRAGGGVLQHGSLRLAPDPPAAARAAGSVRGAATSLEELGVRVPEAAVRSALIAAFQAELGCQLVPDELSRVERDTALARARGAGSKPWDPPQRDELHASRTPRDGR